MKSIAAAAAVIAVLAVAGCATSGAFGPSQRYELKDGNTLYVDADSRMRMFAPNGDRVYMKDGVPMEIKDGTVIVMKENAVWKSYRVRGTMSPRS